MIYIYSLLAFTTLLAYGVRNQTYFREENGVLTAKNTRGGSVLLFFLIALLVWFAGLRTVMNDTGTYIRSFGQKIPDTLAGLSQVDWSIGANPLFNIYQIVLKSLVSSNGQVFVFITSLITVTSMVRFLYKYSSNFGMSFYFFMAFTVFAFTMAAMKQTLATAIGIWALPLYIQNKPWKATLLIIVALLIHPYVVVLAMAFFLANKGVWNRTIYLAIGITVVVGFFFSTVIEGLLNMTELIGDEYSEESFAAGTGVGIMRILSYMIVPVLSVFGRGELRDENNPMQDLFINMSIIGMCLAILSGFGGSVLFGRTPNYFDLCICIAMPWVLAHLKHGLPRVGNLLRAVVPLAFLVFYRTYYHKYFSGLSNPWLADIYARTGLFGMLFGG